MAGAGVGAATDWVNSAGDGAKWVTSWAGGSDGMCYLEERTRRSGRFREWAVEGSRRCGMDGTCSGSGDCFGAGGHRRAGVIAGVELLGEVLGESVEGVCGAVGLMALGVWVSSPVPGALSGPVAMGVASVRVFPKSVAAVSSLGVDAASAVGVTIAVVTEGDAALLASSALVGGAGFLTLAAMGGGAFTAPTPGGPALLAKVALVGSTGLVLAASLSCGAGLFATGASSCSALLAEAALVDRALVLLGGEAIPFVPVGLLSSSPGTSCGLRSIKTLAYFSYQLIEFRGGAGGGGHSIVQCKCARRCVDSLTIESFLNRRIDFSGLACGVYKRTAFYICNNRCDLANLLEHGCL